MNRETRLKADHVVGEPLLFYAPRDKWGVFSNFSKHPIHLPHPFTDEIVIYPTSEHRYQAMKARTEADHDYVRAAPTAGDSKKRGGPTGIKIRDGWGDSYGDLCYLVMFEALLAKAQQHKEFMDALYFSKATHKHIYEDSPVDDIWGWRYREDYRGKNLLGRAIMQVRGLML